MQLCPHLTFSLLISYRLREPDIENPNSDTLYVYTILRCDSSSWLLENTSYVWQKQLHVDFGKSMCYIPHHLESNSRKLEIFSCKIAAWATDCAGIRKDSEAHYFHSSGDRKMNQFRFLRCTCNNT